MPFVFTLLAKFFWFLSAIMAVWYGRRLRRAATARGIAVSSDDDSVDVIVTRLVVRPLVVVSLALGVLQFLAGGASPLFVYCPGSAPGLVTASVVILATYSALIVGYVWHPANAEQLRLLAEITQQPSNLLLVRGMATAAQVGFWAVALLGFDCSSASELTAASGPGLPPCAFVAIGPMLAYVVLYVYAGSRAQRQLVGRPSGLLGQFKRESYTDEGWKWYKRAIWMFVAFLPTGLIVGLIAGLLCPDWGP